MGFWHPSARIGFGSEDVGDCVMIKEYYRVFTSLKLGDLHQSPISLVPSTSFIPAYTSVTGDVGKKLPVVSMPLHLGYQLFCSTEERTTDQMKSNDLGGALDSVPKPLA